MKHDDRLTLRRIADFNQRLAADAMNALEHGDGELSGTAVRVLGQTVCDFGMSLIVEADQRDAIDGTVVGLVQRLPPHVDTDDAS